MAIGGLDLLPVVSRAPPHAVRAVITRSDLLAVFRRGLADRKIAPPVYRLPRWRRRRRA
jgi:hypothetical protein